MLKTMLAATLLAVIPAFAAAAADKSPTIKKTSSLSVPAAVKKFVDTAESKGATIFAIVDHARGAQKVDLELAPAKLVIFGNPALGTPMMLAAPEMGLALPLRVLFYEDADGITQIVYPNMDVVAAAHGLPADHPALAKAKGALDGLTGAATQ